MKCAKDGQRALDSRLGRGGNPYHASSASVAATGLKPLGGLGNVSSCELALCSRASPVSRALLLIVLDCALRALLTLSLSLRKGRFY